MELNKFLLIGMLATAFVACSSDDDNGDTSEPETKNEAPTPYVFVNAEGNSTVSFSGQTTRLKQGAEILKDFTTFGTTEVTIDTKFTDGTGFTDATLNNGKKIKNKVAEAVKSSVDQAAIRATFDGYIEDQVNTLLSKYTDIDAVPTAEKGVAGKLGKRLVTAKGLELNQAFNKGLIGALTLDQIVNDYLGLTEGAKVQEDNTNGVKVEGKPYTNAEHFWDEAYGYLYGASDADVLVNPNSRHLETVVDKFLYKYVQRVESDRDFKGIADRIFKAFKTGREAIVSKDYTESKKQADIIRKELSNVIGIRAVYYLKQGAKKINDKGVIALNDGSAFHDLSEGYGFVYSLQFTNNPATGAPYFTKAEVDGFIATLDAGNGFWDLADDTAKLDAMATTIASEFSFSVAQAKSLNSIAQTIWEQKK